MLKITKTALLFVLAFIAVHVAFAQENQGLIKANKIQGIEVYFLSEPLRAYDVVFDEGTGLKATSFITGGLVNESVAEKAAQFVKRVLKDADKEGKKIDAVIYTSGKKVVAIKFKTEGTAKDIGIGKVQKMNGLEIYVLGEPLRAYDVVNKKGGGLKIKSGLTGGLVNNSIEEDIEQMVNRIQKDAEKDKKTIDAVIYSTGKSAIGVKFK